jgi:hypothetical protein
MSNAMDISTDKLGEENTTIAVPDTRLNEEDVVTSRAARAELCLWQMINFAKAQMDPAAALNFGLHEAEAYMEAVATGGKHPLVTAYKARAKAGRPPATGNERQARRLCVLAVVALNRAGMDKTEARDKVRELLMHPPLFTEVPTAYTLESWETRLKPPLTVGDEVLLARGMNRHGATNKRDLANYFIGMAHSLANPRARALLSA